MFTLLSSANFASAGFSTISVLKNPISLFIVILVSAVLLTSPVNAQPTLEQFGSQPFIRSMSMSPDGTRYAWLQEENNKKMMVVYDAEQKKAIGGVKIEGKIKARSVYFATNNYVILTASDTKTQFGYRGSFEHSGSYVYNIKAGKTNLLLSATENLHPVQEGLGRIIGFDTKKEFAFMPAWSNSTSPRYNLYRVSLKTGKGRVWSQGTSSTIDWFVDSQGKVLAREDFDDRRGKHTFYSFLTGKAISAYSYDAKLPAISVQAVSADEKSLLFIQDTDKEETVRSLNLESGSISKSLFHQPGKDIDFLFTDINRKLVTVKYSGFFPTYDFIDDKAQSVFNELIQQLGGSSVDLLGKTENNSVFLVSISGNAGPDAFYQFFPSNQQLKHLTNGYPNLAVTDLGQIIGFKYPARDGLKIPALLTWPAKANTATDRKNLPLIVMPHGGPNAYDAIGFDWMAQFLANKGYAVLQPNYRGSTGFGTEFHDAGFGRWGKEMQDDITDGVSYLINKGIANPEKVCIAGASYGGYAALAGGAFTPDMYQCVIAINGVSDIHSEIQKDITNSSNRHWLQNYWEDVFGEGKKDFKKLDKISPYFFADQFKAPTLIVYSKDDTVVDKRQSIRMHNELKKAKKQTSIKVLKGEDHWLSTTPMRIELLKAMDAFLDQHNPI